MVQPHYLTHLFSNLAMYTMHFIAKIANRSIAIAPPPLWNKLPPFLRQIHVFDPSYALTEISSSSVYVEFSAHISATFISANTTRRRQSQRLFNSARSNTALTHFGDLHFSEHNSPLSNTGPFEFVELIDYSS